MSLSVVVGGQFGSEGKGKITAYLAVRDNADIVVRCGSTNSGHTVWRDGQRFQLRLVPTGFIHPSSLLMLPAGALIDLDVLRQELRSTGVQRDRIVVDRNAGILEPADINAERDGDLNSRVGSTQSGVGAAVARRVLRQASFRQAKDIPELGELVTVGDVAELVGDGVEKGANVFVEGTQGYGLSLFHSAQFPFATSRDTTASAFLSEVGIGPRYVTDVVMAVRTFPIRVAGNSGPLPNEITWADVAAESAAPGSLAEYTTTTNRLRRVARFDPAIVRRAARANGATQIALHGADYLDWRNRCARCFSDLTPGAVRFITDLELATGVPVGLIGVGPSQAETIERASSETHRSARI